MSLFPGMAKLKSLDFITYDLEWWSSCSKDCKAHIDHPEHVHNYAHPEDGKLRLVGVFDERKGYRKYLTMEKFIKGELHEGNYERVFFAHAGGKYDFQYVFEELVKKGFAQNRYHIEAIFNGASAFLVTLKERKWRGRFQFSDSVFLLKGTLKQIGEKLGPDWHKGDVDFNTNDFEALVTYNEQDCRVLFEGLKRLQTELRGLGGEMRPTLASSAMLLFHSRYLRTPLRTYYPNGEEVRKAYYASRVEVFRPRSQGGFHYDINSSFPWSMTQTLPGQYKGSSLHLPDDPCATPVIAELTVTVPDEFLTPVPFRDNTERILFPTGTWRAYFGGPDIRLMLREGCTIEKVHKVLHYETFYDLTGYVEEMYQLKATEKGFKRDVYKLLLNALYGKFGERPFKEKLVIFPKSSRCPHDPKHEQDECMRMIRPNYYMRRDFMDLEHVHVPIPVFVTAYSRELLYNYMKKCKLFYYVDTDSIDTGPEDVLETSDTDLGALKLEIVVKAAEFISPKLYRITKEDDTTLIKSKGFSKLSDETFEGLLRGESIPLNRQRSIRESIRKGIFEPGRTLVEKRILMKRMKRCMDMKANTSRAWTMKEILQEAAT